MSNIDQAFVQWHLSEAAETAKRRFELGDIILNAVVVSGLQVTEVVARLRKLVVGYDRSKSFYLNAAHICTVFCKSQRETLIKCKVPVNIVGELARAKHDERRRNLIAQIHSGKLNAPWVPILGKRPTHRPDDLDNGREDSGNNPDNIIVAKPCADPERNLEMVEDVLKCIKAKFGSELLKKAFERVVR